VVADDHVDLVLATVLLFEFVFRNAGDAGEQALRVRPAEIRCQAQIVLVVEINKFG
jgi:hypothetical protein